MDDEHAHRHHASAAASHAAANEHGGKATAAGKVSGSGGKLRSASVEGAGAQAGAHERKEQGSGLWGWLNYLVS